MTDRPGLPDLTHQWRQPEPLRDPTWWECTVPGCLSATRGLPPSTICPERVIRWGAEQRAAGAAETRAHILAHLRRPSSAEEAAAYLRPVYPAVSVDDLELRWNGGDPAWTWRGRIVCLDRDVMRARRTEADAIERGEDRTP